MENDGKSTFLGRFALDFRKTTFLCYYTRHSTSCLQWRTKIHAWKFPLLGWPGTTSDTGRVDPAGFGGDGARWSRGAGDDLLVPRPQAPRNERNPRAPRRVLVDKLVVVVCLFTHNNNNNDNDNRILLFITCSRRRFHVTTTTTNATVGPWRTPGPDLAAAGPAASPGNVLDLLSKSSGSLRRRRE